MVRLSPRTLGLALCLVLALDFAATEDKCRSGCHGVTPNNFKFAEGTTYKYNLDSNVEISLASAEGQQSKTNLKATVLLTQQANCNQVIRLQNVQISGSDNKKNTIADIEKAIRINFHDGHVEDVICAEAGDTQNSLNIKRAVASLFQAALDHNHETDVFGVCPTDITSHKDGNVHTITKSRILNRCSHRENVKSEFMATAFNIHSELKSSPILKSDFVQEMKIKDGILEHVTVTENYLFIPFSLGKNGAKATVQTKLHLAGKNKDAPKNKITVPKSILFETPHPTISKKSDVTAILSAVKDTSNSIGTTVADITASKFASLIKVVAVSKKDDLLAVYNQIRAGAGFSDKAVAKKVFLDAIFRAGTGDCIEVSIELLKNKELSPLEQKRVFLGMAFVKHATLNSITSAAALLEQPNLPREAYLAIGTLAARYCKMHECHNVAELNKLEQKFIAKLGDGKAKDRDQENVIVAILKAIANVKYLSDAALPKIIAIAQDKKSPSRMRVAALEAYTADACKDKIRDSAISILKDIQQDAEMRIKAYLALAECPNGKVANAVKHVLDNEPSYQVGSFIMTHIINLRASANPDKALAKRELGNINTMKRYPIDPRKFSHNTAFSYAFDTLGMSNSVEQNVIYSQSSFLPRSNNLNMTTEIFGHKFNLEMDMRQENLDKVLEHYLGPLGVFRSKNPEDLYASGKESINNIVKHIAERYQKTRSKRDVPKAEIDSMGKQVQIKTNDLNTDLDVDMSLKLFGSELLFLSINENAGKYSPNAIIEYIFDALDSGLEKAKNFEHVFGTNMLFLDTDLSYPTSTGFPLRLAAEGTLSAQVKAAGAIDVRAFLQIRDNLLKLSLIPSANIEIAGRMTLDAGVVESGLKVVSTMYTATGGDLNMEVFNSGKGFDLKFALPIKKQEIVSAKHEIVFMNREAGVAETKTPLKFVESKDFSICFDHLSPIIGLTACAEINGPNYQLNKGPVLPFPFAGNSKLEVTIEKDEDMTFHLRTALHGSAHPAAGEKSGSELVLETVAPDGKKKVSFKVEAYQSPEMFIKATLDSPIKTASAEGRITDTKAEKSVFVKFIHDNQEYYGKLGVAIAGSDARAVYKPLIEYKTPGDAGTQKSPYTVEGQIIAEHNGGNVKYTFDNVKIIIPNQKTITITGNLGREAANYFTDMNVGDGSLSGTLKGNVQISDKSIKLNGEMTNTMNPAANFNIKYEVKRDDGTVSNNLQIIHGQDLSSKQNMIKLSNSMTRQYKDMENYHYATKNAFSYPLLGVEAKLDFDKKPRHFEYDVEGKYNKVKFGSEMELKYNEKVKGDYDMEFEMNGFENKMKAEAKREITGDKSKIKNILEVNGQKFEVTGTVTHRVKPNDVDVGADLTITVPTHPDSLKVSYAYSYVPKDLKTHLKVSTSSATFIDYEVKASEAAGAKGHLKIDIKDILTADGEVKAEKMAGKAHLVLNFVKLGRKIKEEAIFNLAGPTYNVAISVYPNFEKDNTKFTVTSNNQIKENSIESKNVVEAFDKKLEASFKGTKEGKPLLDGKLVGEVELILPNEMYLAGKMNREVHIVNGVGNGNMFVSAEQRKNKNTPGRKASFKIVGKDINMNEKTGDATYNLALDDSNGKNLHGDWTIKRVKAGDNFNTDVKGKFSGSVLSEPVEVDASSSCGHLAHSIKIMTTCGANSKLNLVGKLDVTGEGKPMIGEFLVEAHTPNAKFKTIKLSAGGSLLKSDDGADMKGSAGIFIDDDGSQPDATVDINGEGEIKVSKHNGQIKGTVNFQKADPITVALGYGHSEENGLSKCQADASIQYAKNQNIKADVSVIRPNKLEYKMDFKLQTPVENAKEMHMIVNTKRSEDRKHISSDVTMTVDGKTYVSMTEVKLSETSPMFSIKLTHPNGKTDLLSYKVERSGPKHVLSEIKAVNHAKDFSLDSSFEANVESIEDFHIVLKVDSAKLNMDKLVIDAKNQQNKAAKVIELTATSNGKNILKGSTNYKTREEGGKFIVEGSGEFTVKEEKKSGNFKYIRQTLSMDKHGEQGIEVSFDASLGNNAVDSEMKITNKQFRVMNSYCEEKKQCAHFEIDSKTNKIDLAEFSHELEVNIDLRKLGLDHEFGLKAVTSRKHLVFDHTVDVHFQSQENNKYQYSLYVHPKEAGVSLTTPKRVVALEGNLDLPASVKGKGQAKGEVAFYLNKKAEPKKKTSLSGVVDYNVDEKTGDIKSELKFTTPGMAKDMVISYAGKYDNVQSRQGDFTLILDIFSKQNHKLVVTGKRAFKQEEGKWSGELHATAKSAGLNIDIQSDRVMSYDTVAHTMIFNEKHLMNLENKKYLTNVVYEISPKKLEILVKLLNKEILSVHTKLQMAENSQVIDSDVHIFGMKPTVSHFELKNMNTMKFTLAPKEAPTKELVINSAFIPGQIADIRAEFEKNDLIHASIKLDETNFLKPDYGMSMDNINKLVVQPMQKEIGNMVKEGKTVGNDIAEEATNRVKHLGEIAKKNIPNMKPVKEYYATEFQKLREEINADKTIQDLTEFLKNIFGAAAKVLSDVIAKVTDLNEKLMTLLQTNISKFTEVYEKEIAPKIREVFNRFGTIFSEMFESVSDIVFAIIGKCTAFLDAHQAELKEMATIITSIGQDLGRFMFMNYERARELIMTHVQHLYEEVKALPIYEELKARYDMLLKDMSGVSEPLINMLKDALTTLKDVAPTPELKQLITDITNYLEDKLRNKNVNDIAALEKILAGIVKSIKKILSQVNIKDINFGDPNNVSVDYLYAIPKFVAAKFSPLNYILNADVPVNMQDILYAVAFNGKLLVPPFRLYAFIVQGQHIFTFDGQHITFPGKCNYLLARDAVNGNFTIAGTYANGILTALTIADKNDIITIKKGGQVTLNKDATDFPVRRPSMEAFRLYESVHVVSTAGVEVICGPQLVACMVSVSGFYHGQIRGLLGNGNNEAYDDFTMPNGKIVLSESDFGNSYKMAASCAPIKTVDHSTHHHAPSCNDLFGTTSTLRFCFPFVNPEKFRTACDHGSASGVKDTEYAVAMGYVGACRSRGIPIHVPEKFVKCTNSEKSVDLGDTFSVKLPQKAADIIIIVDQIKSNEPVYKELVTPMVAELTKELGAKGINDVEFHLITYGGEYQKYPSHVTTGGKLTFKGKPPAIKFTDEPKEKPITIGPERTRHFLEMVRATAHDLKLALGLDVQAKAYTEAIAYPFRAHATRSILAVTGSPCEEGKFLVLQKLRALMFIVKNINLNLVTPFEGMKVKDPKTTKNVIGFNRDNVFTFTDAKKQPEGSAELHKSLEYSDYCVDFTIKNNGNVFVTENFVQAKAAAKKQFIQVAAHNIVDKLTGTEIGMDCKCTYNGAYTGQNTCKVVHSKEK